MREDVYYGIPENIVDTHDWDWHFSDRWMPCRFCGTIKCKMESGEYSYESELPPCGDTIPEKFLPPCRQNRLPEGSYVVKILTCMRCKNVITRPDGACVYGCGVGADENLVVLMRKQ